MKNIIDNLQDYRDKCYVSSILCQLSSEYYTKYKNIFTVPLLISSSVMTILNSSDINADNLKVSNVIINGITVLLVALMNNSKVVEKANLFRTIGLKFNKLTHHIEDKLSLYTEDIQLLKDIATKHEIVNNIVKEYDALYEVLEYPFPDHIKDRVKNEYRNIKTLPNILNCIKTFKTPELKGASYDSEINERIDVERNLPIMGKSVVFQEISPIIKPNISPKVLPIKKILDYPIEDLQQTSL